MVLNCLSRDFTLLRRRFRAVPYLKKLVLSSAVKRNPLPFKTKPGLQSCSGGWGGGGEGCTTTTKRKSRWQTKEKEKQQCRTTRREEQGSLEAS
ncbi:hypothetical protein J4Q44_G00368720 [Coregonus suidteri]|uniref:Uncharacterized protein n=1 Tax=Coregonus suidteri TaxID=861788 RepID=A0AAN8KKD0_9TELE